MSNGASVRVARAVCHLSQARLAKLTGLAQSQIWKIENDLAQPTPDQWARIWNALTTGE
jgi:transcriptional regulator with XRE-family HTH domain